MNTGADVAIVHVDAHCIVADKPSGLLAVPGRGDAKQDCLSERVRALHADALIVHRLDMATSGLMVMARGSLHQRQLSIAFAERQVHKRYEAVVDGHLAVPAESWAQIDLPLAADWPNRPLQQVDRLQGRPSLTRYRVLGPEGARQATRVELEPVSGRSHQLRVHLQAIGHPILGDTLYAPANAQAAAPRLLLHATQLWLAHPRSGEALHFHSSAPF